ncbi:1,4-alpha-glucan branching protein GlgB [Chondromyces apiculatus]|uniref:1,4-alpha-glucan branching protein GlgB n=1 Tax=Chondromyces apiculatus TaxID=51 RepID=UPI0012DF0052|nr:1,4-alpha-glucan branching protein GlgB [Chondromyces apiculatus]
MVDQQEIARVAEVEHQDPHRILGAHEEGGGVAVRVFRPGATEVVVLPEDAGVGARPAQRMRRIHDGGVFEAHFPGVSGRFRYRIEVRYGEQAFTLHDPYSFPPVLGEVDLHLVAEGTHDEVYRHLGAQPRVLEGVQGTSFAVWAPAARRVSVVGDFNGWDGRLHAMRRMGHGVWEIFVPGVGDGALYRFEIKTPSGAHVLKIDPYGRSMELRPQNASRVTERRYAFADEAWMEARRAGDPQRKPMSIYEVHLGSWRRLPGKGQDGGRKRWMTYRELAEVLPDYVADLGFTHVELLPVMEHPFDGSWGYQVVGYFAPTSRFGEPDDLRYLIDRLHQRGIGVLLDWPPAHFPKDAWALGRFDGTALYEHLDPRQGEHREWKTFVFNYGRNEVRNFLVASALYWLDEFHVDGIRVDAVASMLYLDYGSKGPGDWLPNRHGGRENLEALKFLRELNDRIHARFPGAVVCAEESTSWPAITGATYLGGLGFDFKWNMGWMHDSLNYFKQDPVFRAFHHHLLTFGIMYAWSERYLLPLSHDEVVHLKKSLLSKMPGDHWHMLANMRLLYAYMWAHPGKKLLFMGGELGQLSEWSEKKELDWGLLTLPGHTGVLQLLKDLNRAYQGYPALHALDDQPVGFRWIDANDSAQSVASFIRYGEGAGRPEAPRGIHVVFVANFTPMVRRGYRIGVPRRCAYLEVVNTDGAVYGGSGVGNYGRVEAEAVPSHGFAQSLVLTLPPLGALFLVPERDVTEEESAAIEAQEAATRAAEAEAARLSGPYAEPSEDALALAGETGADEPADDEGDAGGGAGEG